MTSAALHGSHINLSPTARTGDIVIRRHWANLDDPGYLTIEHADPRILVSDELLEGLHRHGHGQSLGALLRPPPADHLDLKAAPHPAEHWLSSTPFITRHYHDFTADPWPCKPEPREHCYHAWLLTIAARNRTVIYRIDTYDQQHNAWEASWPD